MSCCKECKKEVRDGVDGDVYEPPPWMPEGTEPEAICWACENAAEWLADDRRQEALIEAALRAGRPV